MRALLISFFILTVFGAALPAQTPAQAREAIGIPEVQELIMVLFALAEPEGTPSGLIDHGTAYYREVMTAFAPYKGTKVVRRVRRKMKKRSYHLRMDACNYTFDDRHRLVRDPQYDHFSWGKKTSCARSRRPWKTGQNRLVFAGFIRITGHITTA